MKRLFGNYAREISVALTIAGLMLALAISAPGYYTRGNLTDLFFSNLPVLIVALGMTLIIMTGQIDISIGSVFAICSILAGVSAKSGIPAIGGLLLVCLAGALCGAFNGAFVAYLRVPSIVVTLATMVAFRDGLRWKTQGSWVGNLPASFQWLGGTQKVYTILAVGVAVILIALFAFGLSFLRAGRTVLATGSNESAARNLGIDTNRVVFIVFALTGALTGLAAILNSVRFNQIPSNSGLGMEMKVIAAVVVGGTAITGGSGTILGTVLGVVLLGSIGTALTFLGVEAYWEKAIQGGIILGAIAINAIRHLSERRLDHADAIQS